MEPTRVGSDLLGEKSKNALINCLTIYMGIVYKRALSPRDSDEL